MNKEGKKCVIYICVSTEMQTECFSLDAQRSVLNHYAEREGMIVKGIYEDAGKSGKSIEGRPSFKQMLKDIENGLTISYILVYKLSRFGRNAADILNSIEYIQSYDINLIATEEGIDSSQTSGKLLISVLSAVSEIERENILEQTMNGRKEKARQGGWNGGFAPYGYKLVNGQIEVNEEEADVIKDIFTMYVNEDLGYSSIASKLNLQGIKKTIRHNGTVDRWSKDLVKNILINPIYAGKIAFGRRKKTKVKGTKDQYYMKTMDDYIISEGKHANIIPLELWEKSQEKQVQTKIQQPHNAWGKTHLLSGILRCPRCGSPMYIRYHRVKQENGKQKLIHEYACKYYNLNYLSHTCDFAGRIADDVIEPYIINLLKEIIDNEEFAELLSTRLGSQVDTSKLERELSNYKTQLKQFICTKEALEHKIDYMPLDIPYREQRLEDYEKRLDDIYFKMDLINQKIEDLTMKIDGIKSRDISVDKILQILRKFNELFEDMNAEERRRLVSIIIKRINFTEEGYLKNIEFKFPISAKGLNASSNAEMSQLKTIDVTYDLLVEDIKVEPFNNPFAKKEDKPKRVRIPKEKKPPHIPHEKKIYMPHPRAEHYNRKHATYTQIRKYILDNFGLKAHTAYIVEIKRKHGIEMQCKRQIDNPKNKVPHPTEEMTKVIEAALIHFNIIVLEKEIT